MVKREKIIFYAMIVLLVLLLIKSFALDPYNPKNDAEEVFYEKAEGIMTDRFTNFLYEYKIIYPRIVKISKMSEREKTVKDDEGNEYVATGVYKAKVRKYVFGFLPFADEKILDLYVE